jgi:hypothetical protein
MTQLTNAQRSVLLNKAVDLLHEADALLQQAMGAGEECYAIHSAIENAADDIVDVIINCDDGVNFEERYA